MKNRGAITSQRKSIINFMAILCCLMYLGSATNFGHAQVTVSGANPASNGTYGTLDLAFTAINTQAQAGNNIFITITADITAINSPLNENASPWASLTINPVGNRTVSGSVSSTMIQLFGADNVTIDGLNSGGNSLTISNTSTGTNASTISLVNDACNNIITNCTLKGSAVGNAASLGASNSSGIIFIGYSKSGGTGNDNNTISNNTFNAASATLPTCAIRGYNNNTTNAWAAANNNIIISNNNISDYFAATTYTSSGIYISRYNTDWNITNNRFYQTAARTQTTGNRHTAIFISTNHDGTSVFTSAQYISSFTIQNNVFGYATAAGTGTYSITGTSNTIVEMIYLCAGDYNSSCLTSIQGNTFANISLTGSAAGTGTSAPLKLINIYKGNVNIGSTSGNTFGNQTGTGSIAFSTNTASISNIYGILADFISTGGTVTIENNNFGSISSNNTNATPTTASIFVIAAGSTNNTPILTINNNVVGGTVTNSIHNQSNVLATNTTNCVVGIYANAMPASISDNIVRNMTIVGGTGTGSGVNPASNSTSMIGIVARSAYATIVSHNTIYSLQNTNASQAVTVTGIEYTDGAAGSSVRRNMVRSLGISSATASLIGININNTTGVGTFENNMISLGKLDAGTDITVGANIYGIFERTTATRANNFYHNSIQIAGDNVGGTQRTYAFYSDKGTIAKNVQNNIFFNKRSNAAGTGNHYAVRILNISSLVIDYNDYQVIGNGGVLGRINATDYNTLASWQGATLQDLNSITPFTPLFISNNDLHLQSSGNGVLIDGLSIAGIPADIDADIRATVPTIGADEIITPMPVTTVGFDAECQNRKVLLSWITVSEHDNAYFSIERSTDGEIFESIGTIEGAGNSNNVIEYSFVDQTPLQGETNYYRLNQQDYSGISTLSNVIPAECATQENGSLFVSPNPSTGYFVVESEDALDHYILVNELGQIVARETINSNHFVVDLSISPAGLYLIRTTGRNGKVYSHKLMKL